jgi:hypothetical protein
LNTRNIPKIMKVDDKAGSSTGIHEVL